jgi:hypothetical protein
LSEASKDALVDYYACPDCAHVWNVSKRDPTQVTHVTPLKTKDDKSDQTELTPRCMTEKPSSPELEPAPFRCYDPACRKTGGVVMEHIETDVIVLVCQLCSHRWSWASPLIPKD